MMKMYENPSLVLYLEMQIFFCDVDRIKFELDDLLIVL